MPVIDVGELGLGSIVLLREMKKEYSKFYLLTSHFAVEYEIPIDYQRCVDWLLTAIVERNI